MTPEAEKIYVFEEFRLEPNKRALVRLNGKADPIRLANRPFQVLLYLIENRDRFVRRAELLEKFWDGRDVYDTALTKAVGAVRKALGEPPDNPRLIETRWAEGYRFIGSVEERSVLYEIERTREVRLVIEEESDPPPLAKVDPQTAIRSRNDSSSPFRPFVRPRRLAAAVFALLVLGGLYLLVNRFSRAVPVGDAPLDSIAVLPLRNLSGNPDRDVFVDGLTESLIGSLSKIKGLRVISRNSSFVFRDRPAAPREIADRLNVATYLEGSYRENGDRIRVEVRLVNARTGEILWGGGDYERTLGDVFEIQDDISRSVATRLRLRLSADDEQQVGKRQTNSVEAYQNYVKGRFFWKKKTPADLDKARGFFERAIALDPRYALAYAGLADCYLSGIWYADRSPGEALKNAKAALAKIAELDDRLPEADKIRASIACFEWDWENCRREVEKSIEIDPNNAQNWQNYAFLRGSYDLDADEALTAIRRAQELDPLSVSVNTDVGVMLRQAGRFDEAIEAFRKTLETDPQFFDAYWNLGLAYMQLGANREAVDAFLESERLKGADADRLRACRAAFENGGITAFWQKWLEFLTADRAGGKIVPAFVLAAFSARAGHREAAFEWLEKSFAAHEPNLFGLKSEVAFDGLHDDPRYGELLRRTGLGR